MNNPPPTSSAGDDDLNAARIAEQEKELAELTELREALLRNNRSWVEREAMRLRFGPADVSVKRTLERRAARPQRDPQRCWR